MPIIQGNGMGHPVTTHASHAILYAQESYDIYRLWAGAAQVMPHEGEVWLSLSHYPVQPSAGWESIKAQAGIQEDDTARIVERVRERLRGAPADLAWDEQPYDGGTLLQLHGHAPEAQAFMRSLIREFDTLPFVLFEEDARHLEQTIDEAFASLAPEKEAAFRG